MKILLALQSVDLRLALDLLLADEPGATVVGSTCSGAGLLTFLRTVALDLVIMQWQLPGSPPAEILAEARALAHPPRFLILGTRSGDKCSAVNAGADAFVLIGDPPCHLLRALESLGLPASIERQDHAYS
jgi:DNA-binding NarL/FixJ family response regulator